MSSTGQALGYVVGAVAGYFTGGASYVLMGAAIGGAVGAALDPPKGPNLQGPRLNDLSQQTASYGTVIPRVYGTSALLGNIFWIENNALRESSKTESSGGKGGGGGASQTTYSYSATFALGLCEGPIAGVRRIWIMGNLIYDAQSTDIDTIVASNRAAQGFTIHLGDENQAPDARMQATLGVANTPAFRGLAYIVFNDLELEKYGNSLQGAQVKVEVVKQASYTGWTRTTTVANTGYKFSDYYGDYLGKPYILDENGEIVVGIHGTAKQYLFSRSGSYLTQRFGTQNCCEASVYKYGKYWNSIGKVDVPYSYYDDDIWVIQGGIRNVDGQTIRRSNAVLTTPIDTYLPADRPIIGCYLANDRKTIIVVYGDVGAILSTNSTSPIWCEIDTNGNILRAGNVVGSVDGYQIGYGRTAESHYAACCYDQESGLLVTAYGAGNGTVTIRHINESYELVVIATSSLSVYNFTKVSVYTKNNVIYVYTGSAFNVFTAGLISQSLPTLSAIVQAECLKSSILSAGDINVASLTDTVMGYRISSVGAIRAGIEKLQGAWPFDALQSGYQIKAVRRGGASSVATIPAAVLGAGQGGKPGEVLSQTREMDSQLPCRVRVQHLDPDREYNVGEQYAERLNTTSVNETTIELAVVLSSGSAAKVAEVLLYLYWLERSDFSFTLPPSYRYLEPSDIVTVQTADADYVFRLTRLHYQSDGVIECTAKLHHPVYASLATGAAGGTAPVVIPPVGMTSLALIDTACLLDSLDGPGFLIAAAGYSAGWTGAALYRSADGGQSYAQVNAFTHPSTIGYVATAIAAPADFRMMDKASVMTARFYGGASASSVTEAQLLNGANHFAYGADGRWEIIAAQNAVLQADGSYVLTDLLRGRFGTEWAMGSHAAMDSLVLLDRNLLQSGQASLNSIGLEGRYKPVTFGALIDATDYQAFTYRGANLECLSPVFLNGNRAASGDWSLNWLRRTRVGGEWRDYIDAPLGEASEAYEIEIYTSAAYTTLKRTLAGLATASATYTSAQQVTDFGSNQATLYVKVYQLSANVGRGYPLTTSITR